MVLSILKLFYILEKYCCYSVLNLGRLRVKEEEQFVPSLLH